MFMRMDFKYLFKLKYEIIVSRIHLPYFLSLMIILMLFMCSLDYSLKLGLSLLIIYDMNLIS